MVIQVQLTTRWELHLLYNPPLRMGSGSLYENEHILGRRHSVDFQNNVTLVQLTFLMTGGASRVTWAAEMPLCGICHLLTVPVLFC